MCHGMRGGNGGRWIKIRWGWLYEDICHDHPCDQLFENTYDQQINQSTSILVLLPFLYLCGISPRLFLPLYLHCDYILPGCLASSFPRHCPPSLITASPCHTDAPLFIPHCSILHHNALSTLRRRSLHSPPVISISPPPRTAHQP